MQKKIDIKALHSSVKSVKLPNVKISKVVFIILSPWRSRILSLISIFISLFASILSGFLLSKMIYRIDNFNSLLVFIPPFVAIRGNVFGALVSKLSTYVHLGSFKKSFKIDNIVGASFLSSLWLSFAVAISLSFVVKIINISNSSNNAVDLSRMVVILFIASIIPTLLVFILTISVAQNSIKYGWDIDSIGSPIITACADLVSVPSLLLTSVLISFLNIGLSQIFSYIILLLLVCSIIYLWLNGKQYFRRMIIESVPTYIAVSLLSIFAGKLLQTNIEVIHKYPFLLVLAAPLFSLGGAISSLFAAKVSTNLHLGVNTKYFANKLVDWISSIVISFPVLIFLGIICYLSGSDESLLLIILLTILAGICSVLISNFCALIVSTIVYSLGLDPDTFAVPVVTSITDWTGAVCLFFWVRMIF